MHATSPPTENPIATRAAVLALAGLALMPLLANKDDLDALPAWLWAVPTHTIAQCLALPTAALARHLAQMIDAETDARHPAERYVAHLAARHPMLSHVQRACLAEFAHAYETEKRRRGRDIHTGDMARHGFTEDQCARLLPRALELIAAVSADDAPARYPAAMSPADMLRAAGRTAHIRRAYAVGDLELSAVEAARVPTPDTTTGAVA